MHWVAGAKRSARRGVDDAAGALLDQMRQHRADGSDVAEQIYLERASPDIHTGVEHGEVAAVDFGGQIRADVEQPVQRIEFAERLLHQLRHGGFVGQVEFDGDGAAIEGVQRLGRSRRAGKIDVADDDICAFFGEPSCCSGSDPGGTPATMNVLSAKPRMELLQS